jgi:ParB family chromosome partitioning protein
MYKLALSNGLYTSQRKLSESIGVDLSLISKSITLAKLPKVVIDAFPSPLDIQFRWAQPLGEALQKDPEGVITKAKAIHAARAADPKGAGDVFRHLTGQSNGKQAVVDVPHALQIRGKQAGELSIDKKGGISLALKVGALSGAERTAFLGVVKNFLDSLR